MAKIIIRDKLKFRIFPKILWIDNEKIKLKSLTFKILYCIIIMQKTENELPLI